MNKKFKCIIFDLDGTVINSAPDLTDSLNEVLRKEGLRKVDNSILGSLVGGGAEMMIRKGFKHFNLKINEKKINQYVKNFLEFYFENCTKKTELYPGIKELLKYLKAKKIKICLCTNKKQYLTEKIITDFNLNEYFNVILGSTEKKKMKPSTEMLEYCCKSINVTPSESIMIGDSENDIVPARELGIASFFVSYGYGVLNENVIPDFSFDSVSEMQNFIETII